MNKLPKHLSSFHVKELRKIEKNQSKEWIRLYSSMTIEQKIVYAKIKGIQQKEEESTKRNNWSLKQWKEHEFTIRNLMVARGNYSTLESGLLIKIQERLDSTEKLSFFWETASPFSQWYPSKFTGSAYMWDNEFSKQLIKHGYPENRIFNSTEQWMMYCKAMLFLDLETAERIISTTNPREIKNLGRQVTRFNEEVWYAFRWAIVYSGNKYKFTQNNDLKRTLFSTQGTTLVEASPYDKIWGIGLSKNDSKAQQRSTWEGKNLLGEILTELRIELMGHY